MAARISIIGAGNLGCWLGAQLHLAGNDVHFCVRRPMGPVRVDGLPELALPFYLGESPEADLAVLTVKAYDTEAALQRMNAPVLAAIQNGVGQPGIPVLSYIYIEERESVRYAYPPPRPPLTIPAGTVLAKFFNGIGLLEEPDFKTAAWRKMLHNCVSNPLTALAGRGLEILHEPEYREWAERILAEAVPIAQAEGARLDGGDILPTLASYPAGTRTSMLQDRLLGRRLEIDALNGKLVDLGRKWGLPTAANEEISRLLA